MSPVRIASIVFACIFGGLLLGSFVRNVLPEHHLQDDSKDAVKVGAALIATLVALVLGLLVSSAKNSFDAVNTKLTEAGAKIILLDHTLAQYGPETMEARNLLRQNIVSVIELIWSEEVTGKEELKAFEATTGSETVQSELTELTPHSESQRFFLSQALQISGELAQSHWMLIEEMRSSLPTPFLVVLVFWLVILFITFSLFAPRNATVVTVLLVCGLSVSAAIFLILEMNRPLEGMIKVSSAPLLKALEHLRP